MMMLVDEATVLDGEIKLASPALMEEFWCGRHRCLAVDDFKINLVPDAEVVLIRPDFLRVFKDCIHAGKVVEFART